MTPKTDQMEVPNWNFSTRIITHPHLFWRCILVAFVSESGILQNNDYFTQRLSGLTSFGSPNCTFWVGFCGNRKGGVTTKLRRLSGKTPFFGPFLWTENWKWLLEATIFRLEIMYGSFRAVNRRNFMIFKFFPIWKFWYF